MKAIILAAGQAKRLWPITKCLPKCLLKFGNSTIIDRQISALRENDIKNIVVVVGFEAKKLIRHITSIHKDLDFKFIENKRYKETNPAFSLWLAKEHLNDSVIYLNADVFCDPRVIEAIIKNKKSSVTAIRRVPWDEEAVNVVIENNSQVMEMGKKINKNKSSGEFMGVTKMGKRFNKSLIDILDNFISEKEYIKFAADAINLTIQSGEKMYALDVTKFQAIEIDTKEDLEKAMKIFKDMQ